MVSKILAHLPHTPGTYALQLHISESCELSIGQLGEAHFPSGTYLYVGSARGPGGIRARLGHHVRGANVRPHWHIDHLRSVCEVISFYYLQEKDFYLSSSASVFPNDRRLECLWSKALSRIPQAQIPLSGFGASDCRSGCPAHLVAFPDNFSAKGPQATIPSPPQIRSVLASSAQVPPSRLNTGLLSSK